ncbi:carbohydrate sulfotransferase 11-like [Exaiptasia diaphana]|uniref:Carbohydrate sulfotransferase n=1 Tax=Exaiptasia diaphana TaxID=2652724 RepID=A0A913WWR3_EXADI|nr:carbohydrate sulfotransferase 11-like [Exaiptasia diaphana]
MVKLLLFRAFSLLCLFALLIWESLNIGYEQDTFELGTLYLNSPGVTNVGDEFSTDGELSLQEQRKQRVIDYCHERDPKSLFPRGSTRFEVPSYLFRNIIVSDKHNLLYCYIPKVACSNWKRVLMVLNGDAADPYQPKIADLHNRSHGLFRYLHEYPSDEIVYRLNTYYKFLFVRHPFERLVSAYRNKFIDSYNLTLFKKMYGRRIIRHFRRNPDPTSLRTGEGVSFSEFVKYLLKSDPEYMDQHWKQYDMLCHPCLISYDYIGHFENLLPEANTLLKTLQVDDVTAFPGNMSSKYKKSSLNLAKQYFKKITREQSEELYNLYRHDFNMFGYSSEEFMSKR